MEGTVKFFDSRKGFGFITVEGDKDYFVHISDIEEGVRLNDGDQVAFDVDEGERGPKAVNVTLA